VSDAKAAYKWLKGGVEFIDEVPKNPTGKIVCYILAFNMFRSSRIFQLRRFLREKAKALKQTHQLKVKL
jgi:hypothetical protein